MTQKTSSTSNAPFKPSDDLNALLEDYTSKLEQKIAYESQFFRLVADSLPQMVWTAQPDGVIDYYNKQWHEFTGLNDEELMNNHILRKFVHPDDMDHTLKSWRKSIQTGEPMEFEHRMRNGKTGEYVWFLVRGVAGRDNNGKLLKWFGTCTDINDHKKAQQKKDEFIAIASHELKTPVTSIKAFTQLLQRRLEKAGQIEFAEQLGKMNSQVDKLTNLIKDLLDVSKIESGKLELHPEIFDFDEFVHEAVENLRLTASTHKLIVKGKTGRHVSADRDRIEQVLINLVSNGIKYSPDSKEIVIHLRDGKNRVELGVQDFGVGIPKKDQKQIFERFYRVSGPALETFPGLGLGLFISAEIINRQHGILWVESEENKGSTFYFSLPATKVHKAFDVVKDNGKRRAH